MKNKQPPKQLENDKSVLLHRKLLCMKSKISQDLSMVPMTCTDCGRIYACQKEAKLHYMSLEHFENYVKNGNIDLQVEVRI